MRRGGLFHGLGERRWLSTDPFNVFNGLSVRTRYTAGNGPPVTSVIVRSTVGISLMPGCTTASDENAGLEQGGATVAAMDKFCEHGGDELLRDACLRMFMDGRTPRTRKGGLRSDSHVLQMREACKLLFFMSKHALYAFLGMAT